MSPSHPHSIAVLLLALIASGPAPAADGTGLLGIYFSEEGFSGIRQTRIDPTVDFAWLLGAPGVPGIGADHFSVIWKGQVEAQFSETYTFSTVSDDGVALSVDGRSLIIDWTAHRDRENNGTITLIAGRRYDLVFRYMEITGTATAKLLWSSPSTPKQIIPQSRLFPAADTSPLTVASPLASRTSPAWLEGTNDVAATTLTVKAGTQNAVVTRESPTAWCASLAASGQPSGIPLSVAAATRITIAATTLGVTSILQKELTWEVTDLGNLPYGLTDLYVRSGDQVLFAASGPGTTVEIDTDFDGSTFHAVKRGTPSGVFPVAFTVPGAHRVCAMRDGVEVGNLTVVVLGVDWRGPTADEVGYQRTKTVGLTAPIWSSAVVFTANDPDLMLVEKGAPVGGAVPVKLAPLTRGSRILQARVGNAVGPVIAQQAINTFYLDTSATGSIGVVKVLPDGSQLCQATLSMSPLIPNLSILMTTFVAGVTFDDSTTRRTLTSAAFTATPTGGDYTYFLLRAPVAHAQLCHRFVAYQSGVQISR